MSGVLLVQNARIEGPGHLGELLKSDGFEIIPVNAKHERLPGGEFSLAVILGAPESANDDLPYLRAEEELVRDCVRRDVPVLGICLGSQLIARAFGARVYRGPRREVGFYGDLRISGGSSLLSGFADPFTVFHWHGDTFELPEGSARLASSQHYPNQAFRYGSAVGLQFHLEVDEEMVNLWLDSAGEGLEKIPHIDPERIRSELGGSMPSVKSNMEIFYKNFKSSFRL